MNSATSSTAALTVVPVSVGTLLLGDFSIATPVSGLTSDLTGGTVTQGNNSGTTVLLTTVSVSSGYTGCVRNQ